jgi:hypothetical protein
VKRIDRPGLVHEYGGWGALFARFAGALTNFADERDVPPPTGIGATGLSFVLCVAYGRPGLQRPAAMPRAELFRSDLRNSLIHKWKRIAAGCKPRSADGLSLQ